MLSNSESMYFERFRKSHTWYRVWFGVGGAQSSWFSMALSNDPKIGTLIICGDDRNSGEAEQEE